MIDPRFEPAIPLPKEQLEEITSLIGHALPETYSDFILEYGGAFVGGYVDGNEALPVMSFFGAEPDRGLISRLGAYPDFARRGILPIASCELGNLYVLERDGSVHYVNYYGASVVTKKVADSFGDFVSRIVITED